MAHLPPSHTHRRPIATIVRTGTGFYSFQVKKLNNYMVPV
jgi:hypothetical protein